MTGIVPTGLSDNTYFARTENADAHAYRLIVYVSYLNERGLRWHTAPDLAAYRDALLARGLAASSVAAYLTSVRSRYAKLLKDPDLKRTVMHGIIGSPADQLAVWSSWTEDIRNAIDPERSPVRVVKITERTDDARRWLTVAQARQLLEQPRVQFERGHLPSLTEFRVARDETLMLLMLLTGLRREEAINLTPADVYRTRAGAPGVEVRAGKGAKQRFVFYGQFWDSDLRIYLANWMSWRGDRPGALFPALKPPLFGFPKRTEDGLAPMSLKSVNDMFALYPISIDGKAYTVKPHDTRRFYALLLRDGGMALSEIAKQLGHEKVETLMTNYLPPFDVARRLPKVAW